MRNRQLTVEDQIMKNLKSYGRLATAIAAATVGVATVGAVSANAVGTNYTPAGTTVPTYTNLGGFVPTCTGGGCAGSVSLAQWIHTEPRCYSGGIPCDPTVVVDYKTRFHVSVVESFACASKADGTIDRDHRASVRSDVYTPWRVSKMPVSGNVQAVGPVWLQQTPAALVCLPTQAVRRTAVVITPLAVQTQENIDVSLAGQPALIAPSWAFASPTT